MTDKDKVMGVDLTGYRLSDESLKQILEDAIKDIRLRRMHGMYDMPIVNWVMIELVARELERNAKRWKVTQEDWPEIKKSLEDVGIIVEEQKKEHKLEEKVFYGVTIDLKRLPSIWMESYDEAYESALERRENLEWKNETVYIIEQTERYEIVDLL